MSKFGISAEHYSWIKKIFKVYLPDVKVSVFGSRARGDQKRYSDLDLALESLHEIDPGALRQIQEQFSTSSLPIKIDLVELKKIDAEFKKSIQDELIEF